MMNSSMKLVLRSVVTTLGNASRLGGIGVVQEGSNRYFGAKGGGGRKGQGQGQGYKGLGTRGAVLVTEDIGAHFTKCITRADSDNKGAESGNKIWFITNAVDIDSFDSRYHLGKQNLIDARSSAGKNGLTEVYGVYPTAMAAHPILGKMKFVRIYVIHPRYTNWIKLDEKEKAEAAGLIPVKVKTAAQEEQEQKNKDVIKLNSDYLQLVMENATKMIDSDSRIILLHPTCHPYSTWKLDTIATKCGLKLASKTVFDKLDFPGFSPRRAGTDLKLVIPEAKFYSYRLLTAEEKKTLEQAEAQAQAKTSRKKK